MEMVKKTEDKQESRQERIDMLMAGPKGLELINLRNPEYWPVYRPGEGRRDYMKRWQECEAWVKENNRQFLINKILKLVDRLNGGFYHISYESVDLCLIHIAITLSQFRKQTLNLGGYTVRFPFSMKQGTLV